MTIIKPFHASGTVPFAVGLAIGLTAGPLALSRPSTVKGTAEESPHPSAGLATAATSDTNTNRDTVRERFGRYDLGALERLRRQGIEITQAELDETLELSRRRKNGEYLLLFERPATRWRVRSAGGVQKALG